MIRHQRLRSYLAKLFFAAVVPLLVLAALLIEQVVGTERETRLHAMQDLARTLSSAIDAEVDRTLLALQLLANSETIDRLDLDEVRAGFEQARGLHGRWSSMSLFKADGTRLLNLRVPAGRAIPRNEAVTRGLDDAVRAGRTYVSDVATSSTSGKPTVFFGVPVIRNGTPVYGITATMEYDAWTDWLKQRIPEGAIAAIDDRNGVIFARSERPEPFAGRPATAPLQKAYGETPSGIVRNVNREGVDIYVAYTTSDRTGWHTLIILPASVVNASAWRYGLGFAGATAVVLLLTLVAARGLARPLADGIERLRDSIRRVGLGEHPAGGTLPILELDDAQQAARQAAERLASARDELVRQREELRTMLDLLPVGVAVAHDAQARRISVSPVFARMLGLQQAPSAWPDPGDGDARPFRCLRAGQEVPARELPLQRAALTGAEVRDVEFDIELRDGTLLHMLAHAAPLFDADNRVRGAIAAHVDITALKAAQHTLQQADRQKNEFLATLAHELRNPMAPIRYASALLARDASAATIEKARVIIERQSAHMARLLDDLLDLSRISRNAIELKRETVDLQRIVLAAADNARVLAERRNQSLTVQPAPQPLWVDGDAARLLQVMDNLLNNACKYTPAGGRIVVTTAAAEGRCEVRIADNGVGITPDMIPQMFSLFGQAHRSLDDGRGGLGIGLTVVRRLVELHEGTIDVHSDGLGAGSTFVLRLPAAAPPAARAEAAAPAPAPSTVDLPLDVLIVDDNRDVTESLAGVLEGAGYAVRTAASVDAALACAAERPPDVAVLDLGLPDGSGTELAQRLRSRPGGGDLVLVAVTGWGDADSRARTATAGFDAHLVKPVDAQGVVDAIQAFAGRFAGRKRADPRDARSSSPASPSG